MYNCGIVKQVSSDNVVPVIQRRHSRSFSLHTLIMNFSSYLVPSDRAGFTIQVRIRDIDRSFVFLTFTNLASSGWELANRFDGCVEMASFPLLLMLPW